MRQEKIKRRLDKAIEEHICCSFLCSFCEDRYHMFPLRYNDTLVLAEIEDDFRLNGYLLFSYNKLKKIRMESELHHNINQQEGIIGALSDPNVDITAWHTAFEEIQKQNQHVIVECGNDWLYTIGKIVKVKKNKVFIHYYDAEGLWESKPREIHYRDINNVYFGDRYSQIHAKYVGEPPSKQENTLQTDKQEVAL